MDKILVIGFLLFSFSLLSKEVSSLRPYKVISETVDASIPKGQAKISGIVYHGGGDFREPLIGAKFIVGKGWWDPTVSYSDSTGGFQFSCADTTKQVLVMYNGFTDLKITDLKLKSQTHYVIEVYFYTEPVIMFKPVIYAYFDQPKDVQFTLNVKGNLTFTYPVIENNSWKVTTQTQGGLKDAKGNTYPYLFWEANATEALRFNKQGKEWYGNFVMKDSVISFLEKSLTALNFNAQEKTDFITFWGPRMIRHEKVFVQFLVDENYDQVATLDINPKPDHLRRVYMLFRGVENSFEYSPQRLQGFDRSGFTVLEWGGSELPDNKL